MECSFCVHSYWSESDYRMMWQTTGQLEKPCNCHPRITVQPGDLVFVRVDEASYDEAILYRVPVDPDQFAIFCQKAQAVAGQAVLDRFAASFLHARSYHPRVQLEFKESGADFKGEWLAPYAIGRWRNDFSAAEIVVRPPHTLEDARQMLGA